ncbi:hypothetical protein LSH36_912g01014 [Paralvinella palmiformis]|uniref:Uncharacterized protein n=1 Tax=Paralvinella palmiformis TaxID=53620 RepID=A0AAD9IZ80_9ANNE|nr:hypothetical protein LSH36_912g01014 [Paralvinella palmiformis]
MLLYSRFKRSVIKSFSSVTIIVLKKWPRRTMVMKTRGPCSMARHLLTPSYLKVLMSDMLTSVECLVQVHLLRRELIKEQPICLWYRRWHRLSSTQRQILLYMSQTTHPLPGYLRQVVFTVQCYEDGPCPSRPSFCDRSAKCRRTDLRRICRLQRRTGSP